MDDVKFNLFDKYISHSELFFATTHFRNCVDVQSGRVSESDGRLLIKASGSETTVDIPTELLWRPMDGSFIEVTASKPDLIGSVEAVRSYPDEEDWRAPTLRVRLSRALSAGEEVTFDWSAAVRPIPPHSL